MVQYTQYGLNHIDTVSSSTMASSYSIAVNDTSENYKFVIVTGSMQYDGDVTGVPQWKLLVGADYQSGTARSMISGTTTTSVASTPVTNFGFGYYSAGNDNYTTLSGQMLHFILELDYTNSGPNDTAPYKRRAVKWQSFYYSGSNPHITYGTANIRETDSPADEIVFSHSGTSTNVTVNATSYGIGSITST